MEQLFKANRISKYQIRMITENTRILAILLIEFLFIMQNLSSVLQFSKSVNIPVMPYAFPFLVNDSICQFIITAGVVVIFSNAPFENEGYYYILPRAGRMSWALGQVLYIFKISLFYLVFLMLETIIPFIGHLNFDTEWGKIWIGLLIYFGNKMTNKSLGTIAGVFFTLLDVCIANDWTDQAYRISPTSLAQMKTY